MNMAMYQDRQGQVKNKTYIVLGTGRSGTSFIVDALSNMGVKMGSGENGNLENVDFRNLNKDILREAGGDGFHPPSTPAIIKAGKKYRKRAKQLIDKYQSNLWGFKDPRTTLALPAYLDLFEGDVYLICCVRQFDRVVKSMILNSKGHSIAQGVDFKNLTSIYLDRLTHLIKDF